MSEIGLRVVPYRCMTVSSHLENKTKLQFGLVSVSSAMRLCIRFFGIYDQRIPLERKWGICFHLTSLFQDIFG